MLLSLPVGVAAFMVLTVAGLVAAVAAAVSATQSRDRAVAELAREKARARTDALTGALNRHALGEALVSEQARISRGAGPTGIFFLDADRFRDVNNKYGYATGDALLVAVHDRLRSRLRASDSVYRWGGEEFVVIAPEIGDHRSLVAAAERLRTLFADELFEAGQHPLPVTASIGAALLERGGDAFDTLEHAGYLAKSAKLRRNTVVVQTLASTQAAAPDRRPAEAVRAPDRRRPPADAAGGAGTTPTTALGLLKRKGRRMRAFVSGPGAPRTQLH